MVGSLGHGPRGVLALHCTIAHSGAWRGLAEVMGDADILMMANHGVMIAGRTIAAAYDDLYYLEQTCRTLVLALSTGQPLKRVPQDVAAATARQMGRNSGEREGAHTHFAALKRILDREQPDYAV